ncbi:MAG: hypothetical protein LWX70_16525, partial [Sphingobacteriia bacterium]|nr:hypothetical protein [Sphingobacteriia bacterium]
RCLRLRCLRLRCLRLRSGSGVVVERSRYPVVERSRNHSSRIVALSVSLWLIDLVIFVQVQAIQKRKSHGNKALEIVQQTLKNG